MTTSNRGGVGARALAVVAVFFALSTWPTPALAQQPPAPPSTAPPSTTPPSTTAASAASASTAPSPPSAADLASARELYKEGKELRAAGDTKGALEKLKAAHALGQTPVTGVELGKTYIQVGQLVEAREVFLAVGRMQVQADETEKSETARAECAQLADELKPRIPSLTVKVNGVPSGVVPVMSVDGANVPAAAMFTQRRLNPGPHEVVVRAGDGPESRTSVDLKEGEDREISVGVAYVPPPPPPRPVQPHEETRLNPLVFVGGGVAGAGLIVGGITGAIAISKGRSVSKECTGTVCPASAKSDVDSGRTMGTISTIAFVAAGVGVGVGIYGLLSPVRVTKSDAKASVRITPAFAPGWAGLDGSF